MNTRRSDSDPPSRRGKTGDDAAYLKRVGDRVRAGRDALGLTRRALSEMSGVSERYLADLEAGSGNASLIVLRRIAEALHLDMETLLSEHADRSTEFRAIVDRLSTMSPSELTLARQWLRQGIAKAASADMGRIALIGLRGAGKTTIGRAAAEALDVPFIELDREIERTAGMELAEIFALHGGTSYRDLELRCLTSVIEHHPRAVIATGGGLVTEPAAYDLLLAECFVIWLAASPESHMDRVVEQGDLRPMADNPKAMDDLRAILSSRRALYARAHATVDTTGITREEATTKVLEALAEGKPNSASGA